MSVTLSSHEQDLAVPIMPKAVSIDTAIDQIESMLDTSGILTVTECDRLNDMDITDLFFKESAQFEECFQNSSRITDSLSYSRCLQEAEKKYQTLCNINDSIKKREQVASFELGQNLPQLEKQLMNIRKGLPIGDSVLLSNDIRNLREITTIAAEKTYESVLESGNFYSIYYEPQISRAGLLVWAGYYERNCKYTKVGVAHKVNTLCGKPLGGMCSYISLGKTLEQQDYEREYYLAESVESPRLSDKRETSVTKRLLETFGFRFSETDSERCARLRKVKRARLAVLEQIRQDLVTKLAEWKIERFEILSYAELREVYQLSDHKAKVADFIVLYHKKVVPKDVFHHEI